MTIETGKAGKTQAPAPAPAAALSSSTPLGRARGLGPAHRGGHHWGLERATSVATLALLVWLAVSLLRLPALDHQTVAGWLQAPLAATPMLLLVVALFWHLKMGLAVVVEDYVHEEGSRLFWIAAIDFASIFFATLALFSVLKIALGGGAAA
jgi:succinate dehydrogenase / fumarate reductase membrane anchor subunit